MSEFNDRFGGLTTEQQDERYGRLAEAALAHYDIDRPRAVFIRHNGGVTYRVECGEPGQQYLLKIAQPIGESGSTAPDRLVQLFTWLAALARETSLVIQEPIPNRDGELLTAVDFVDLSTPFYCSLQEWVAGRHMREPIMAEQAYAIGRMTAQLHIHSSRWLPPHPVGGMEQNQGWLAERLATLSTAVRLGLIQSREWRVIEQAVERVAAVMAEQGRGPDAWGLIHGDLHHRNLLFQEDDVRPIDFGDLRLAHYSYDLGVTLYHFMYLDAKVRNALVTGYHEMRPSAVVGDRVLDAFLCAAALSNLSFQITIPRECVSAHFHNNLREFATGFCVKLVSGEQLALT